MSKDITINLSDLPAATSKLARRLSAYKVISFFLVVAVFYGFIIWRINVFSNVTASQSEETAQASAQPHIDPTTVQKIQSLQDNSVNVQSLFDAARQNPFQE